MRKTVCGLAAGLLVALISAGTANAFDASVSTAVGDQGSDFQLGQQLFLFPHTLPTVGSQVLLQFTGDSAGNRLSGYRALDAESVLSYGTTDRTTLLYNTRRDELSNGAGLVLPVLDNLQLGFWLGEYQSTTGAFVAEAMQATGWTNFVGVDGGANDLQAIDPYAANLESGRQVDFFGAYQLAGGIDLGLRFWYGSAGVSVQPDEFTGPVDVNPGSSADVDTLAFDVEKGSFSVNDLGVGLSAGYTGLAGMTFDAALQLQMTNSIYNPNNLGSFYDMSGMGIGVKLRGMYEIDSRLEVGASVSYFSDSASFKPLKQRDGGDLPAIDAELDDPSALDTPGTGNNVLGGTQGPNADAADGNELTPVANTVYAKAMSQMSLSLLAQYQPVSAVQIYAALGLEYVAASQSLDVNGTWVEEENAAIFTAPFLRLGINAGVTDWLDVMLGAVLRSYSWSHQDRNFDSRIPADAAFQGGGDAGPAGNEDATNQNRREILADVGLTSTTTQFMTGLRAHTSGMSFTAHVNPDALFNGMYLLFGQSDTTNARKPLVWLSFSYSWGADASAPKVPASVYTDDDDDQSDDSAGIESESTAPLGNLEVGGSDDDQIEEEEEEPVRSVIPRRRVPKRPRRGIPRRPVRPQGSNL